MNYFVTTSTSYINFKNYTTFKFVGDCLPVSVTTKYTLLKYTHFADIDNANLLVHYYGSKKSNFTFLFLKTDRHHGYLTVLFGRITMPFLKNTASVPLFFVILQCFLLYVSFLSVSVLFGNVVYSFIRRHSDDNGLERELKQRRGRWQRRRRRQQWQQKAIG